jgi:hypothetical protein
MSNRHGQMPNRIAYETLLTPRQSRRTRTDRYIDVVIEICDKHHQRVEVDGPICLYVANSFRTIRMGAQGGRGWTGFENPCFDRRRTLGASGRRRKRIYRISAYERENRFYDGVGLYMFSETKLLVAGGVRCGVHGHARGHTPYYCRRNV